jgi:predicted ArsR family transcriptional regulator
MKRSQWKEKSVIELLRQSGKMKTTDVITGSNMCKATALKYMNRLRHRGVIDFEKIGPTKLWYLKNVGYERSSPEVGRTRVFQLIRDFEEMTGVKANFIISSESVALTLGDPQVSEDAYDEEKDTPHRG